jgi:hypothetical protein
MGEEKFAVREDMEGRSLNLGIFCFIIYTYIVIILEVMKIRPLETHSKVLEVEYRLCKYPYLSKESLPGTADALVFQKLLTADRRNVNKLRYANKGKISEFLSLVHHDETICSFCY